MGTADWSTIFIGAVSLWGGFVFLRLVCIARAALVMGAQSDLEERIRAEQAKKDARNKLNEMAEVSSAANLN